MFSKLDSRSNKTRSNFFFSCLICNKPKEKAANIPNE